LPADVERMVLVGQVAWHGLGKVYPEGTVLTGEQVLVDGGLDWEVEVAPIVTDDVPRTSVDDWRVTRRKTDQRVLGVVKKDWKPVQNRQAVSTFDSIVSQGKARYETAGALQGGSKVFFLAKLGEPLLLCNHRDAVDRYLLLSNAHDGKRPLQLLFTPVRVVCSNTLSLALHRESDDDVTRVAPRVTIQHRAGAGQLLKESERVMGRALRYYELFGEFADFLTRKQASADVVETVVETVFPPNRKGEVTDAIAEHRSAVTTSFEQGAGTDIPGVAGTAWALLNGFTEYASHGFPARSKKVKTPADRAYSVWLGGGRALAERANRVISKVFV